MLTASMATDGAGAVVGCSGAALPAIEVASEHDDFIFFGGTGDLSDDVEGVLVVFLVFDLDVEGELWGDVVLQQADDAVVLLCPDGDHGRAGTGSLGFCEPP